MTEDPEKRWEICAPIGQEAKELPKSVEDLLAEQKERARLKEEETEKRRKENLRAGAKRTYQVETTASSEPLDVDPPGEPGDEFTALLVATASFLSAIICTTVILCCCCGVCSGPKVAGRCLIFCLSKLRLCVGLREFLCDAPVAEANVLHCTCCYL